jgi:hypothetical protein
MGQYARENVAKIKEAVANIHRVANDLERLRSQAEKVFNIQQNISGEFEVRPRIALYDSIRLLHCA